MSAHVFRYNVTTDRDFSIPYPTHDGFNLSIISYSLNIVNKLEDLNLIYVKRNTPEKHRVFHFIIFEEETEAGQWIDDVFREFWQKEVLNAFLIFQSTRTNVIGYDPFKQPNITDFSDSGINVNLLFSDQLKDLNGYQMDIALFYEQSRLRYNSSQYGTPNFLQTFEGVDGEFARFVIQKLNATLNLIDTTGSFGEFFSNGSASGTYKLLIEAGATCGLNARLHRYERLKNRLEISYTVSRDDVCILVPKAGLQMDLSNIFHSFDTYAWILILVTIPTFTKFFNWFLKINSIHYDKRHTYELIHFYGWSLGQATDVTTFDWLVRSLVLTWVFYSFLILNMYEIRLAGNLVVIPKQLRDINTMADLDKSGLTIRSESRNVIDAREYFIAFNHTAMIPRIEVNPSVGNYFYMPLENETNMAFVSRHLINVYILINTTHGRPRFHEMDTCISPHLSGYLFEYGSMFRGRLNFVLRSVMETGVFLKWFGKPVIKDTPLKDLIYTSKSVPFALSHLQTIFFLYIGGCCVAICAFLYEHLKFRYELRRNVAKIPPLYEFHE